MALKTLIKNPILGVGILLMAIFLMGLYKDGKIFKRENLIPTSCKATIVKLERRIPANWSTGCEGNNLWVHVQYVSAENSAKKVDSKNLKKLLYREIANYLILIAKNSPSDNLERTEYVRLRLIHPELTINALTQGKFLVKLATLKDQKLISEHLKVTVQVQETKK
ncbi:hypothetical protein OAT67_09640 [Bacteriovoracaceae bacterium]|nr:hypothetical protein [Bacteriovoracaceae bacterium]|tara:strand:+ start:19195 stop:19692 length:498 start_codon:yes stop_codon:yes gene_type:complete